MTCLRTEDVSFKAGGRTLVDRVSLVCKSRQFVALLGANGAGKSSLIRMLTGLVSPTAGTILLDDRTVQSFHRREMARRRAYIPQNARVEWPIAVERLVALGLMPQLPAFGDLDATAWYKVEVALRQCGLIHKRHQPADTLSGGELARAMLARALVGNPDILIADEPLAGLDPRHAIEGMVQLAGLARAGRLVIASIHDLTLAARYATHVAILHQGRLTAFGPTQTTLTPANIRTAFEVNARIAGVGTHARIDLGVPAEPAGMR